MILLPRERLWKEAWELLKVFLKEIRPLAPKCVLLFGSYAKKNFTESSDLDVCIIAEKLPQEELARRCLRGSYSTSKIKAIGFFPEEFLQYLIGLRFLAFDIVHDGLLLYDDGFYAKIRDVYEQCIKKYTIIKEDVDWRWKLPSERESQKCS